MKPNLISPDPLLTIEKLKFKAAIFLEAAFARVRVIGDWSGGRFRAKHC